MARTNVPLAPTTSFLELTVLIISICAQFSGPVYDHHHKSEGYGSTLAVLLHSVGSKSHHPELSFILICPRRETRLLFKVYLYSCSRLCVIEQQS